MNILVTGKSGQLGVEIEKIHTNYSKHNFIFKDKKELDITNFNNLNKFFKNNDIKLIINCAAYTNVNGAEIEKKIANKVNNLGVENLSLICKNFNCKIIHISTDYVFDGLKNQPYKETDFTNPINYYGFSKLEGEKKILKYNINALIIRTSWLYSSNKNNFFSNIIKRAESMDKINVVNDQIGSPTSAHELAKICMYLSTTNFNWGDGPKIYNFSNEGMCSWYEFAKAIILLKKIPCNIIPIKSNKMKNSIIRPKYSVLDKSKIKQDFNISPNNWYDSLKLEIIRK